MRWLMVLAGLAALLVVFTLLLPAWRRMWVFYIYFLKYAGLWLADRIPRVMGREPGLTGPLLVRRFCEDMGPTYIKFAQIVASSSGMFPERYVAELQKCLDRVRPFPFDDARRLLIEELGEEKAAELAQIEREPLASASIAQVHAARLPDGTEVVVKIQRPGIEARIRSDVVILRVVAALAARLDRRARMVNPVAVVDDFATTLAEEIDFRREARNLDRFNEIMRDLGYSDIRAPIPRWEHTARRVLAMERFRGVRIDCGPEIAARGIDAEAALIKGIRAWFQSVIFHGFFHGDVHAGNLMLLDRGGIGFLDLGIVGRYSDWQRALIADYLAAFAAGDYRRLAQAIVEMGGAPKGGLDLDRFATALEETYRPILSMALGELNYADLIPRLYRLAREHRITLPREFVLITKQMLYFDRYAKSLAPGLNVFTDPRLVTGLLADIGKARSTMVRT